MKNLIILVVSIFIVGCGPSALYVSGGKAVNGHSAAFDMLSADSTVCPAGGSVLSAGVDLNDDLVLQPDETKQVVVTCNGTNGSNGTNGINGTNGTDATPVTIVPLCPGVNSYPSTYIEVGLCLGGTTLIAVYSANGGFATVLSPGNYSSNAIGSSCNLTVGPNCTVTH